MPIPGNLLTTAMAVMPHTDPERALDIYTNAEIFSSYAPSIKRFLDNDGVIVWGIVPTGFESFNKEGIHSLSAQMENVWRTLWEKGIDRDHMFEKSMLSPATCCLVNPDMSIKQVNQPKTGGTNGLTG